VIVDSFPTGGVVEFSDSIDLLPIPVSPGRAARQALLLHRTILDAGGIEPATHAAVEAILAATPADPPSEVKRLRLLYQRAYSHDELEGLATNTFAALGLLPT
jgi:hypothetical protein